MPFMLSLRSARELWAVRGCREDGTARGGGKELRARVILAANRQAVLDEIDRKKRIAAYGQAVNDARTQAITQKSTEVTRAVVTQKAKSQLSVRADDLRLSPCRG